MQKTGNKSSSTYSLINEVVPEPGTLLEYGKV
jgi:hypothetical protein